ncbi:hypothetical protein AX774_g2742 [Zancudomyces culisetae]|uniref:Uncharacterized protein n=1 Tax=Zancudomyces culisetae TaxID=1213189 RepID=A0A1R1PRZ9_ZANCU|nr:hypothetical protein AX774_g2742 [Zancudomyces culisetae]|eukprot:OMH83728.1 hypothetical protein AX774_g2742 [Zancudomyces culisetae]
MDADTITELENSKPDSLRYWLRHIERRHEMDEDSESETSREKSGQVGVPAQDHTHGDFQDALNHVAEFSGNED